MTGPSERVRDLAQHVAEVLDASDAWTGSEDAARLIDAALAEAWDEGADSTFYDPESRNRVSRFPNPYREKQ